MKKVHVLGAGTMGAGI
nr:RecName: Full=3-hydroxybutyryl-CoA dehydrogenase; AltName: Full=Beta-hydroxybutyryl-CoA dehydrogenase; Short=BHBD; AltName: Full=CP 26 [Clostridium pasteurianum]